MTRIAFISDIHSNLEALQASLNRIDTVGADAILCLGDIVGYGPNPSECIQIIRDRNIPTVMGNHDEYVFSLMDPAIERLRPEIQEDIAWNQQKLSMDEMKWLSKLPLVIDQKDFVILHSSFTPKKWAYCLDEKTFANSFSYQKCQLAFCGHSHFPLIGIEQGPEKQPFVDYIHKNMSVPNSTKVMVNVGSIGQPRDHNPDACIIFYELEKRTLWMDRVHYNTKIVMEKIFQAGLPRRFGERLLVGR